MHRMTQNMFQSDTGRDHDGGKKRKGGEIKNKKISK